MGVHSGKFAVIDGLGTMRNWSVNDVSNAQKFVASNTRCGTGRVRGTRDWTGNVSAYGAVPLVMPGQYFDFRGYTAPANNVSGSGPCASGNALVESVTITWNWGNGEILAHQINFGGNGELTWIDDFFEDVSVPVTPIVCGTKILQEDEIWPNLVQASLTLTAPMLPYVNSATDCWTYRRSGPFDWTLSLTEQNNERDGLPEISSDLDLKLFVNASEFWHLRWGHLIDYSNLSVDRETGAIISRTVNLGMSGFVGGETGHVLMPDESTFWPEASVSSSSGA